VERTTFLHIVAMLDAHPCRSVAARTFQHTPKVTTASNISRTSTLPFRSCNLIIFAAPPWFDRTVRSEGGGARRGMRGETPGTPTLCRTLHGGTSNDKKCSEIPNPERQPAQLSRTGAGRYRASGAGTFVLVVRTRETVVVPPTNS